MKTKRLHLVSKYHHCAAEYWRKAVVSDENRSEAHGWKIQIEKRSRDDPLQPGSIQKTP